MKELHLHVSINLLVVYIYEIFLLNEINVSKYFYLLAEVILLSLALNTSVLYKKAIWKRNSDYGN